METTKFVAALKKRLPCYNFKIVKPEAGSTEGCDLILVLTTLTNSLEFSFHFTGDLCYGLSIGTTSSFNSTYRLIDSCNKILDAEEEAECQ